MTRTDTFKSIYGVGTQKEVKALFTEDLKQIRRVSKTKQYQALLEKVLHYSYAIFYDYKTVSIRNNRLSFRKIAMDILKKDDVEKAFSFLPIATPIKEEEVESKEVSEKSDVAINEVTRLKDELENQTYTLSRGQKVEDKEAFIRIAIVALSAGARLSEIMYTLKVSIRKGKTIFINNDVSKEGVLIGIDSRACNSYLKSIRSHYEDRLGTSIDISTGIRKAIKRLDIDGAKNLNDLNAIYKDAI